MYKQCLIPVKLNLKKQTNDAKKCGNCYFTTFSILHFLGHFCEAKKTGFQCDECYTILKTKNAFKYHKETVHELLEKQKWLQCEFCFYKAVQKVNLDAHIQKKHANGSQQDHRYMSLKDQTWLKCQICDYKTLIKSNFDAHIEMKHVKKQQNKQEKVQCELCKSWLKKSSLKSHMQSVHVKTREKRIYIKKNQERKCDICQKTYQGNAGMQLHLQRDHNIGNMELSQCPYCDYKTLHRSSFKVHILKMHEEGKEGIKCDFCDYKVHSKPLLNQHIWSAHSKTEDIKWFKCSFCCYKSRKNSGLKRHLKTCKGKKFQKTDATEH